ncbi:MAG: thymidine phosphorylase family protein [Gammaproteobacteria bacterium]
MSSQHTLILKKIGIDTYKEAVIYMRADCPICRAEGFAVHARVQVAFQGKHILATLNMVENGYLADDEAALSKYALKLLEAKEGDTISLSHPAPLTSLSHVRSKIYGHELSDNQIDDIVHDIAKGYFTEIHVATFLTACAGGRLNQREINALTSSMVLAGERLSWQADRVVDKHCVGGLPGNRTTLIVVPIVTAFGLTMPKTSSRSITSPAGTADVMEVFAPVDLNISEMRKVVEKEHGCIVWGGSVALSPADEILISVERVIDLDSEGQLVASVLSKKIAAGSTHIVIDMPVGPTAKIRSMENAQGLRDMFVNAALALGVQVEIIFSDGYAPVGRGIGPCLEAQDILSVLKCEKDAPKDLRDRALTIAGRILEFSPRVMPGTGRPLAKKILESGEAWKKFQKICEAQGGMREITCAKFSHVHLASSSGNIIKIDNRNLARLAKLAGAPNDQSAGIYLHIQLGQSIQAGEPLFTLYAEYKGELEYAKEALSQIPDVIHIERLT